jgi:5-methylthioadenosine/S-adenosylhomocysteine deaminase
LPTHNIIKTFVGAVGAHDVNDVIIDGKLIMKNREVLTLDEEEILYNSKKRMESITSRAGI